MTVCVYALTTSRHVPDVTGVPLRSIRVGSIAAIVSDARRVPSATPQRLRRYHRLQVAIAEQLPAMLPVRFGTVMEESELRFILASRRASLRTALRQVRGRVQFTLRLRDTAGPAGEARPTLAPRQERPGTAYLRELTTQAARARRVPGFDPVREAVAKWVDDERILKQAGVISIYHLVRRRSAPAYVRRLGAAAATAGVRVMITGPFPPYAFSTF